jgi:hypothetical protein
LNDFPVWYRSELVRRSALVIGLRGAMTRDMSPSAFYHLNYAKYVRACEWDIVTSTQAASLAARDRIDAGESFQSVAKDVSLDKGTGPKGGKLGCNERQMLVPQLDDPAFTQPIGYTSEPIKVDANYHLLLVTSRSTPPFDWIHGEIQGAIDQLGQSRVDSAVRIALESTPVHVSSSYGSWNGTYLRIDPPAGPIPTPLPAWTPPVAHSSTEVDPFFQVGQQIFITDGGFRPQQLVSTAGKPITWTNETRRPQIIRIEDGPVLGPIAPRATVSYRPAAAIAIQYDLGSQPKRKGQIQVEPASGGGTY